MSTFVLSIVFFALFYAPLRAAHELWTKDRLPPWFRYVGGLLAWGATGSAFGPFYAIGALLVSVGNAPDPGQGYVLCGYLVLLALIAKLLVDRPDILRWSSVKPFFLDLLRFKNLRIRRMDIFEEQERHTIERIHREQTGRPLPQVDETSAARRYPDARGAEAELEQFRRSQSENRITAETQSRLASGEREEITDEFRLHAYRHKTHELYDHIVRAVVDARERTLRIQLVVPGVSPASIADADGIFRIKQNLYDFLQVIHSEIWLRKYKQFIVSIFLECFRIELNTFDLPQNIPFMKVGIFVEELTRREHQMFNPADLHTIASVEILSDSSPT